MDVNNDFIFWMERCVELRHPALQVEGDAAEHGSVRTRHTPGQGAVSSSFSARPPAMGNGAGRHDLRPPPSHLTDALLNAATLMHLPRPRLIGPQHVTIHVQTVPLLGSPPPDDPPHPADRFSAIDRRPFAPLARSPITTVRPGQVHVEPQSRFLHELRPPCPYHTPRLERVFARRSTGRSRRAGRSWRL